MRFKSLEYILISNLLDSCFRILWLSSIWWVLLKKSRQQLHFWTIANRLQFGIKKIKIVLKKIYKTAQSIKLQNKHGSSPVFHTTCHPSYRLHRLPKLFLWLSQALYLFSFAIRQRQSRQSRLTMPLWHLHWIIYLTLSAIDHKDQHMWFSLDFKDHIYGYSQGKNTQK